jgi:ankyrin repeat protein
MAACAWCRHSSRKDYATPPHDCLLIQRYSQGLESHSERPLDSGLDAIDDIENALPDSDVIDVSSEESIDADMDLWRENGLTPLHLAASEGHLDICQMLLERNADVRVHDDSGDTPLHLAASSNHLEIARILLKYNAEVNSRNEDESTPLLIASSRGNLDILRLLLAHNADAFVHDNRGSTPLHLAAIRGHLEVARSLLELKVDVNALDNEGSTPLHQASQGRQGETETSCILCGSCWTMVQIYMRATTEETPHFISRRPRGHLELLAYYLSSTADVNSLNEEGLTPLQRASQGSTRRTPRNYAAVTGLWRKCERYDNTETLCSISPRPKVTSKLPVCYLSSGPTLIPRTTRD